MRIKGKVVKIGAVEQISEKFKKQTVILEQADTMYDAKIPIEFAQDKGIALVSNLKEGNTYEISINIAGREWKDRYFVSLKAWNVEEVNQEVEAPVTEGENLPF
jgi:ABC-type uncharacterized transport system ATPase subunit